MHFIFRNKVDLNQATSVHISTRRVRCNHKYSKIALTICCFPLFPGTRIAKTENTKGITKLFSFAFIIFKDWSFNKKLKFS